MDCRHCGKRVAKSAARCGHCGHETLRAGLNASVDNDAEHSEAHHSEGGYDDSNDDFDYDEYVAEEFGEESYVSTKRNLWWYVAFFLLILFAISALFPMF